MNILIIVDSPTGGAGNIAQILANEIASKYEHVTLLFTTNYEKKIRYNIQNVKIDTINMNIAAKWKIERTVKQVGMLRDTIIKHKSDIVLCFLGQLVAFAGLASIGMPWKLVACERNDPRREPVGRAVNVLRFVGYCRANSISIQFKHYADIYFGIFKNKCVITPNYVNRPALVKRYGSSDYSRTVRFVSLGRIASQKNYELMISLFEKIHGIRHNTELHIYGNGNFVGSTKPELAATIQRHGLSECVFIHESTSKPYEILASSDIYLMTSKYEGFPNALCEAMSVGLPCVVFECHEGLREIIDNRSNGFLIKPDAKESFINCCINLIDEPSLRKKIGQKASTLINRYSSAAVTERWIECIDYSIYH